MRSILITPKVEELAAKYNKELFKDRHRTTFLRPLSNLAVLYDKLATVTNSTIEYEQYVVNILAIYPTINTVKPSGMQAIHDEYFADFDINLSLSMHIDNKILPFYKHVTAAMRYDAVRDQDFLHYAKLLGIRACVYCNANYAVTFGEGTDIKGKYELDHFKPQSRFPYLCTNFFNLFPVCGNCNKAKLHTDTTFSLFTEDPGTMYPFTFTLDKASIIRYMLSQDFEDLEVTFDGHSHPDHDTTFKINDIYGALKDVAEELVWKYKIYSPSYLKSLNDAFGKKFVTGGFNRLILGNYDQPKDIHKRPLSKLTQDIARQLRIIK